MNKSFTAENDPQIYLNSAIKANNSDHREDNIGSMEQIDSLVAFL